jgi:hypothetical protein
MKDDTCFSRDERPLSRKIKNFFEHSWWPSVVSDLNVFQCPFSMGGLQTMWREKCRRSEVDAQSVPFESQSL